MHYLSILFHSFPQRISHLKSHCQRHSGDPALQPQRADRTNDFYFVMDDLKLSWCPVPHAARTSWALNFLRLRVGKR